jgi:seryl-tRNA synthetase
MEGRGIRPCSEEILFIDNIVRENKSKIQDLQHERNEVAKQMSFIDHKDEKFEILKDNFLGLKLAENKE